jgi:hypothetical protein
MTYCIDDYEQQEFEYQDVEVTFETQVNLIRF